MNFFSLLNDTNSQQNYQTGECILTVPVLELRGAIYLNPEKDISISSNCQTIIKCEIIDIMTNKTISFSNITFEEGVFVRDSTEVKFTNCTIKSTTLLNQNRKALLIFNTKSVSLSHFTITDIEEAIGIDISSQSHVTANDLSISNSKSTLIVCRYDSTLLLKDSKLTNTSSNAIYANESHIEIQNCNIFNTNFPAIFTRNSTGKILNNVFKKMSQSGISSNSSTIDVIGNELTDVNGSAISFIDGSKGLAHQNRIYKINGNGIYVADNSDIKITENEISDNIYPGIAILKNSKAIISKNKIFNIKFAGICVRYNSEAKIEYCEINDTECGISISDLANCFIENNIISKCQHVGIEVYNEANAKTKGNKICDVQEYAFLSFTSAFIEAENNDLNQIGKSMVKMTFDGGCEIVNNNVRNCPQQKEGKTSSHYFLSGNGVFQGVTNIESRKSDKIVFDDTKLNYDEIMCLKCNKNQRDSVLLSCGHNVYCMKCANEALDNKENCPLCRIPIDNVSKYSASNESICLICMKKKQNCIFTEKDHKAICTKCLEKWFMDIKNCKICKK